MQFCYAQGIAITPSRIFFKGSPGQMVSEAIVFTNNTNTEVSFVPSFKDWDRDSLGVKHYFAAGSTNHSNADWLSLSDFLIRMQPNESKKVTLSMKIPESKKATNLSNSMLFFTQVKEQSTSEVKRGLGFNIILEVGIQVYHIPAGLPAGNLEFLAFEKARPIKKTPFPQLRLMIRNTGSVNKDAFVRLELTSKETGKEIKLKPIAIAMLPKAEQWVQFAIEEELKGTFLAVAILDEGQESNIKVAQKELEY